MRSLRIPVWTVRTAQESDIDQLLELRLALQKHHENLNSQLWRLSARGRRRLRDELVQLLSDRDACVFVALDGRESVVGMIVGRVIESDRYVPAISGSIERLFVLGAWRRRGIGTELVKRLCRFFASRHVEDISVRYIDGNSEAIQFWNKLGFQSRIVTAGTKLGELEQKITEA